MAKRYIGVGTWESTTEIEDQIAEVLKSGRISYGPKSKEFEREIANLHGNRFGVLSNSGTSSLLVALQALKEIHGWPDGSKVAVPASTFVATINVVLQNKMVPVLVDVEKDYYAMSVNSVFTTATKQGPFEVVMPVNPFGQPADLEQIRTHFKYGSKLVTDSCECLHARHLDKPIGEYAAITCFSFYIAHILTTGVGGMAITDDERYAVKMRSLVNHGRDNIYITMDDTNSNRLREVIGKRFEFDSVGHSFRITELESAIGLAQLESLPFIVATRRDYAVKLRMALQEIAGDRLSFLKSRANTTNSWMMFPVIVESDKFTKGDLTEFLEKKGIETRDALPIIFQPVYKGMWDPYDFPVAKKLWDRGFYIGCHQGLNDDDLAYTVDTFKEFLNG